MSPVRLMATGFVAVSDSPPTSDSAPSDNSPALPELPVTTFSPDPTDATLVGVPVSPDGQLPNFDGVYTGSGAVAVCNCNFSTFAIAFSVSGNTITLTAPGSGSGIVDAGGGVSFSILTIVFSGSITTSGGAKSARGTYHGVNPAGDVLSGPWSATAPG